VGKVTRARNHVSVAFDHFLLLEASPVAAA